MKKIYLIPVLVTSLLMVFSCNEEFLEKDPPGALADAQMQSPAGVEGLLVGAYAAIKGAYWESNMITDIVMGSWMSDDMYFGSGGESGSDQHGIETWRLTPTNGIIRNKWQRAYEGVHRANDVLEFLWINQETNDPIPTARANEIEGEAKFLRAWFHLKITKHYHKIPYILTETERDGVSIGEIKNDSEGWDEIEADLQSALDAFSNSDSKPLDQVGRIDRFVIMAVKAHVHLYQNELSEAKTLLDVIISEGGYELAQNYNYNYDMATENNRESIFEFQGSSSSSNRVIVPFSEPAGHASGPAPGGWGFNEPSQNLFEAYQTTPEGLPVLDVEDREPLAHDMGIPSSEEFIPTDHLLDPRVDWTLSRRGIDYLGWGICEGQSWIRNPLIGTYMTKKTSLMHKNQSLNTSGNKRQSSKNWRFYRYGHVLLWRAEIAAEENDLDYARELVNMIRQRAKDSEVVMGLVSTYVFDASIPLVVDYSLPAANYKIELYPGGADAFSTQEEAIKAVRLEQRLEFGCEGMRFFDLRRWGIADEVLNAFQAEDVLFRGFMQGAIYDPVKDDYWPIPQGQIDIQTPVLEQDPSFK